MSTPGTPEPVPVRTPVHPPSGVPFGDPEPLGVEPHLPHDAQHVGLMPVVAPELAMASALRADRPLHKVLAWAGLAAVGLGLVAGVVQAFH